MTIGVLGAGYVGLATAASFAARGFAVVCADIDEKKIAKLQIGELPFFEEGMGDVFATASTPVTFTTNLESACLCDIVFCCVGTPSAADGSADLSFVRSVAKTCADIAPNAVFVLKSTVPPGTSRSISEFVDGKLRIAANPEFLREGNAVQDALNPTRVVIGADDESVSLILADLYKDVGAPIVSTNTVTAEMIKYASNSFLATKISFINDIANLCDVIGADVQSVATGMGLDDRIGAKFLQPGPGYGGSCFPKDVRALMHLGQSVKVPLRILEATTAINADRQRLPYRQLVEHLVDLKGKRIAVWGLAFKPGTDDVRDAPALGLLRRCMADEADLVAFDPLVRSLPSEFGEVEMASSAADSLRGADAVVIMTDWPEFSAVERVEILKTLRGDCVIDPRYVLR
ncbi:MAG: UDP-glucose/GDP-mannose dehydrogenase family protein [Patescibacteria group bacterium]